MPYVVAPMCLRDIPEVEAIERVSFSSPWTRRAYEYDLAENPLAHYLVVRQQLVAGADPSLPAPDATPPSTWTERLGLMLASLAGALHLGSVPRVEGAGTHAGPPILGFAGIWMAVQESHLVTIAVAPAWRQRGLGELLLVSCLDLAVRLRATSLFLEVRVSNIAAKAMYDKYGFEVSRIRKAYYSDNGEDALEMVAQDVEQPRYQARVKRLKKMLVEKLEERAAGLEPPFRPDGVR